MNPLIPLSVLYFCMTVGSAGILYFSFKGQIDTSGKFFLLAEAVTIPMIVAFGLINAQPVYQKPAVFFFANALGLCAEVAILFSIHALTRKVQVRKFILLMLLSTGYCGLMEISRHIMKPLTNVISLLYILLTNGGHSMH